MKIDAFHYVQLGTAYRSVLPRPCPVPPAHTRAPLWTGGLCASTQGPPACARRRGDRALWGHPAHPSLPDERLLRQGRRPPTAAQAARSVHSGAQCLHPGVPALTPKPHCPWVPRAGGLAQPVLLPQGPSIKQFMDIFSLPEMAQQATQNLCRLSRHPSRLPVRASSAGHKGGTPVEALPTPPQPSPHLPDSQMSRGPTPSMGAAVSSSFPSLVTAATFPSAGKTKGCFRDFQSLQTRMIL